MNTQVRALSLCWILLCWAGTAGAKPGEGGARASLYLPLESRISQEVERMAILTGMPCLILPYPLETVRLYNQRIRGSHPDLYRKIARELDRLERGHWVRAGAEAGLGVGSGGRWTIPNAYGLDNRSAGRLAATWVTGSTAGSVAASLGLGLREEAGHPYFYAGNAYLSVGIPHGAGLQLDLGWRDRWYGVRGDGTLLMSTQAQNAPAVSLQNQRPWTRLRLRGEIFAALLERSPDILHLGERRSGRPALIGMTASLEPIPILEMGLTRTFQFGGAGRAGFTMARLWNAFFWPADADNSNPDLSRDEEFGNQLAAASARIHIPSAGLRLYGVYGAEDTSRNSNRGLGVRARILGFYWLLGPVRLLGERTYFRDRWYVHFIYGAGYTNRGNVMGHWFGDTRAPGDGRGGYANSASIAWDFAGENSIEAHYRSMEVQNTSRAYPAPPLRYVLGQEFGATLFLSLPESGSASAPEHRTRPRLELSAAGGRTPLDRDFTSFRASVSIL